ncbi:MAG: hypothetical protein HUU08_15315 [Candidatus Brocadia sp.]|nr:hypothetical protein [Candidatus Brocadia sp.]
MPDYFVRPCDVLFFRGNKSFHFGEWYSEGIFPPYPSTFQGFVRTKILFDKDLIDALGNAPKAEEEVGNDTELKVDITGPYLMDNKINTFYFKTPADILKRKCEDTYYYSVLGFLKEDNILEGDLEFNLSCPDFPPGKLDNLYPPDLISLDELLKYRTSLEDIPVSEKNIVVTEDRAGIGLDFEKIKAKNNRGVQEGRFYVTPYNRPKSNIGFYFNVSKDIKNGTLKLGSESHLVYVQDIKSNNLLEGKLKASRTKLIEGILKTKTFRLILLQPGVFKNGWFPFDYTVNGKKLIVKSHNIEFELLFAFNGAPVKISGYSYAKNTTSLRQGDVKLKSTINAVPAGAVYLFKIINGSENDIKTFVEDFDNKKILYEHYSTMGFNHTILGIGPG